jgi:hypothetical protein
VLAVLRRWNGNERLLLVNFSDTAAPRFVPEEARASSWETIFATRMPDAFEARDAGPEDALPPWSAVILRSTR